MFKRIPFLALMCLAIGCSDNPTSPGKTPADHPVHTLVFLNGNDTNDVDLLIQAYTDEYTLGDTLLHQLVAPGEHSDTVTLDSEVKFRYTLYWADSTVVPGPMPQHTLAAFSYSNFRTFIDKDSAHYAVSMKGDVVTFTGSN